MTLANDHSTLLATGRPIAESLLHLIGNTPLLRLNRFSGDLRKPILAKLEMFNPMSSVKDRIALQMVLDAEKEGKLIPGISTIVEPTSGNTGIGLAMVGLIRGYQTAFVIPDSVSHERRGLLRALGARVDLSPAEHGFQGVIDTAVRIVNEIPHSWMPMQFANPSNPRAHFSTTAQEILRDTNGKIDFFVAGIGTGGTLCGIGAALKKHNPNIKVIAVEPANCALLSGGEPGRHKLQGLNAGFIAETTDLDVIDEAIIVEDEDAFAMCRELCRTEGVFTGPSSGASLYGALEISRRNTNSDQQVVCLFPDCGERYLSTPYW